MQKRCWLVYSPNLNRELSLQSFFLSQLHKIDILFHITVSAKKVIVM